MLTKNQLAKQTEIPISTLKYYMDKFPEYFEPQFVDDSKYPQFEEEAVDIALLIRELMNQKINRAEIKRALEEKDYMPVYEIVESTRQVDNQQSTIDDFAVLTNLEASTTAVEILSRMNNELTNLLKKQESDIQNRDATIEKLQRQIEEQNKTIEELQSKTPRKKK